jgi:hypothetical protein
MRSAQTAVSMLLLATASVLPALRRAPPASDACPLLTAAEVSAVLGIASLPGRPFLGSQDVCYFAADTSYDTPPSVTLMVMTTQAFQNQGHLGGSLTAHPLAGLGDEAFYVGGGSYFKVAVRKGSRALSVTIVPGGKVAPAQVLDMEKALAAKAVARL